MTLILRILLIIAAPITALVVSRDAINFGIIETLIAIILIALLALLAGFWTLRPPGRRSGAN
jgi:hypothetical protein